VDPYPDPILCWVVDGAALARFGDRGVRAACDAGVDWLQVRDRGLDGAALLAAVDCALSGARASARRVRVIVNRRADVAAAAGADGVHLGFDAVSPACARALLGTGATIGISLHDPAEVAAVRDVDYVHLAPIFAPLSKAHARAPLGLDALRDACRGGVPVIAQGGIEPANARAAVEAGAAGVAVIGAISGAADPARAAQAIRCALAGGRP
jgi:thiamine-phosphate pyrophosphorylase